MFAVFKNVVFEVIKILKLLTKPMVFHVEMTLQVYNIKLTDSATTLPSLALVAVLSFDRSATM